MGLVFYFPISYNFPRAFLSALSDNSPVVFSIPHCSLSNELPDDLDFLFLLQDVHFPDKIKSSISKSFVVTIYQSNGI